MRRLKSVSLTIPCVVGPYTSINCTLTLLSNKTRVKSTPSGPYVKSEEGDDGRFVTNLAALQSVATSHAQNDSGIFELNFRDERYLPFEGAGAIRGGALICPRITTPSISTLSTDVMLHLKYTAREGGDLLRKAARQALHSNRGQADTPLGRLFSLKHEFPNDWYRFLHPKDTDDKQTFQLDLTSERFPFQFRGKMIQISQVELFLKLKDEKDPLQAWEGIYSGICGRHRPRYISHHQVHLKAASRWRVFRPS